MMTLGVQKVMSKVLLLSRDNEIKDPNILDQIRSR